MILAPSLPACLLPGRKNDRYGKLLFAEGNPMQFEPLEAERQMGESGKLYCIVKQCARMEGFWSKQIMERLIRKQEK